MPRGNWSLLNMHCPPAFQALSTGLSRCLALSLLSAALFYNGKASAAEGGYSNYIPGSYGDFGMALAPTETWTLRYDIYNTENDKTDYQSGQEVHLDVVLNQFLSDSFAIGLQGFYLKQITGDDGDGAILGDFKAEAAGVGPALLWSRNFGKQNVTFIAKWLHEFHAERRLEGDHFYLSFALDW